MHLPNRAAAPINTDLNHSFAHGLVIGKFYPPHLGHCLLIRNAASAARLVTVVVMANHAEHLGKAERVQWLRAEFAQHPHVRIVGVWDDVIEDYNDDAIWQAHIDLMHDGVEAANAEFGAAPSVDAVFSSEPYGERMAGYFNALSVQVDTPRGLVPISATKIRRDLIGAWRYLPNAVQAGLCHRIVIVGGESAGKTTLAQALTQALQARGGVWASTTCVAEYGREYNQLKLRVLEAQARQAALPQPSVFDCVWHSAEFFTIAKTQLDWEEQAAQRGAPVMICDTDAFATQFWHERYMGSQNADLAALVAAMPKRSLYILPKIGDVPFEQDGLRDGEHLRQAMHQQFKQALQDQNLPWLEVSGSVAERVGQALAAIDGLRQPFEQPQP